MHEIIHNILLLSLKTLYIDQLFYFINIFYEIINSDNNSSLKWKMHIIFQCPRLLLQGHFVMELWGKKSLSTTAIDNTPL